MGTDALSVRRSTVSRTSGPSYGRVPSRQLRRFLAPDGFLAALLAKRRVADVRLEVHLRRGDEVHLYCGLTCLVKSGLEGSGSVWVETHGTYAGQLCASGLFRPRRTRTIGRGKYVRGVWTVGEPGFVEALDRFLEDVATCPRCCEPRAANAGTCRREAGAVQAWWSRIGEPWVVFDKEAALAYPSVREGLLMAVQPTPQVGVAPACRALGVPRASFYRRRAPGHQRVRPVLRPLCASRAIDVLRASSIGRSMKASICDDVDYGWSGAISGHPCYTKRAPDGPCRGGRQAARDAYLGLEAQRLLDHPESPDIGNTDRRQAKPMPKSRCSSKSLAGLEESTRSASEKRSTSGPSYPRAVTATCVLLEIKDARGSSTADPAGAGGLFYASASFQPLSFPQQRRQTREGAVQAWWSRIGEPWVVFDKEAALAYPSVRERRRHLSELFRASVDEAR